MSLLRRFSPLGLALLLLVGVSCTSADTSLTEAPVANDQQAAPSYGLIGDLTNTVVGTVGTVTDVLACSPQPYDSDTQTIGSEGGIITVGKSSLFIPRGALTEPVKITAEQISGTTNSVRFSPEGLKFAKSAVLTINYDNCALVLVQKKIVYTDEQLKVQEVLRSLDLFGAKSVGAPIDHFSRYAVAY
jgi:hypothetical protein